jgi:hypothetical protein
MKNQGRKQFLDFFWEKWGESQKDGKNSKRAI